MGLNSQSKNAQNIITDCASELTEWSAFSGWKFFTERFDLQRWQRHLRTRSWKQDLDRPAVCWAAGLGAPGMPPVSDQRRNSMRLHAALLLAFVFAAGSAGATPLTLAMSPAGSDSNNCRAVAPCLTLGRIQAVIRAVNPQDNVTVNIALGTYRGQAIAGWTYVMPNHTISFVGEGSGTSSIPLFDNCIVDSDPTTCTHNVWFKLRTSATQNGGHESNLVFDHLKITHYGEAIWLSGDRSDSWNGWNGGNVIKNCVFAYDGNAYAPSLPESWATIRLYNSRRNYIANNLFEHIWTTPYSNNVYLHALYIASYASNNVISGNMFWDVGGDTIRFRDASNYNQVTGSTFWKTGEDAPITSWFCHPYSRTGCGKAIPECPSTGNVASSNYYTGGDKCPSSPPPFTANLYGAGSCNVPVYKQGVAVSKLTTNFSVCSHTP
jgi:hypothetical protein